MIYRRGSCGSPVFVIGNAFCMEDDLARATEIYGDADKVAVNGASREVQASMLVSQHPSNFVNARWVHFQRKFHEDFTTHATSEPADVVWSLPHKGGSAWLARRIAGLLGYDPVVLVGCPMVPGNYANHRPGLLMTKQKVVDELFEQIVRDTDWHGGCVSMSGRTRELLC